MKLPPLSAALVILCLLQSGCPASSTSNERPENGELVQPRTGDVTASAHQNHDALRAAIKDAAEEAVSAAGGTKVVVNMEASPSSGWTDGTAQVAIAAAFPLSSGGEVTVTDMPVEVSFTRGAGADWQIDSAKLDAATMQQITQKSEAAEKNNAALKNAQAVFSEAAKKGGLNDNISSLQSLSLSNCEATVHVAPAWLGQPTSTREMQVENVASAWLFVLQANAVDCSPVVEIHVLDRKVASWDTVFGTSIK